MGSVARPFTTLSIQGSNHVCSVETPRQSGLRRLLRGSPLPASFPGCCSGAVGSLQDAMVAGEEACLGLDCLPSSGSLSLLLPGFPDVCISSPPPAITGPTGTWRKPCTVHGSQAPSLRADPARHLQCSQPALLVWGPWDPASSQSSGVQWGLRPLDLRWNPEGASTFLPASFPLLVPSPNPGKACVSSLGGGKQPFPLHSL